MSPVKPLKLKLPIGFLNFLECHGVGRGDIGRRICTSQHHRAQSEKPLVFIAGARAPLIVWLA